MAETQCKRQREEETQVEDGEDSKRHKTYNHILSLLEEDEDEANKDLSSIITTLQEELSCDFSVPSFPFPETAIPSFELSSSSSSPSSTVILKEEEEEEDNERVIRHLLEASDDELGIPQREIQVCDGDDIYGGNAFAECGDDIWQLEDEAANYYALLQAELFM